MYPGAPGYGAYPPGWAPPRGPAPYQAPPPGPVPYQAPPPGPMYYQPPPPQSFGLLSPHLQAFNAVYDADQTWDCNPSDCGKELGLLGQRVNDIYPQGKDNCAQFLRECQAKGLQFKVKAKKTRPYWTWYYEVVQPVGYGYAPQPRPMPHHQPPPPQSYGLLSPHLQAFNAVYDADQTWDCNPSDCGKELGLLGQRVNDIYPQGKDNCAQFLRECQAKGLRFKVKARKTSPYWTWYYEVANPSGMNYHGLSPHLHAFTVRNNADQTWECSPHDVPKELGLLNQRINDTYPQGKDNCAQFLRECQAKGLRFKVKARKTSPYWTWYYEIY